MKELYFPPELNVICFAPMQRLANTDPYSINIVLDLGGGLGNETSPGGDEDFGTDLI